jgi:hypothetical protein
MSPRARAVAPLLVAAAFAVAFACGASPAAAGYVSLGDSYSSGEGAGTYDAASGACHRSAHAWPRLLGVAPAMHLACSGATTAHVLTRPKPPDRKPQIASLRRLGRPAFLHTVLVTIGGNDLRFSSKVLSCRFGITTCLRDRRRLDAELARVEPRIVETYRRIRTTSLPLRVIAVGYPDIVPDAREHDTCGWLSASERANIAYYAGRLDDMLSAAAVEAGVSYLPVRDALDDHELCTRGSWMVAIARPGTNWLRDSEQGHPDQRGQKAIAESVRSQLLG